jgi:hypothetical protein
VNFFDSRLPHKEKIPPLGQNYIIKIPREILFIFWDKIYYITNKSQFQGDFPKF